MSNIIYNLYCPSYIEIKSTKDGTILLSKVKFSPNDILYSIKCLPIKQNEDIYLYSESQSLHKVDIKRHTINRGHYRHFTYFDMFMNHSCDPNTILRYTLPTEYPQDYPHRFEMKACKPIYPGDELTVDYTTFDSYNDDEPFECHCGKLNCKKWIV